jgi:dihydroorotase
MNESELATRLGLPGIPVAAETVIIERDLRLVQLTGGRYHLAQVSSADSVASLRQARALGLGVSCGVSINHLLLNENDVENYRSFAKLNPPLRAEGDRLALVDAVSDGIIDVIVSAHNPQDADAKRQPFQQAAFGSVGVETLLTGLITLHHSDGVDLLTLLRAVTSGPADILGIDGGRLALGAAADLTLLDLDAPWIIDADDLASKSKNAVLEGRRVQGRVEATFVAGKCVYARDDDLA